MDNMKTKKCEQSNSSSVAENTQNSENQVNDTEKDEFAEFCKQVEKEKESIEHKKRIAERLIKQEELRAIGEILYPCNQIEKGYCDYCNPDSGYCGLAFDEKFNWRQFLDEDFNAFINQFYWDYWNYNNTENINDLWYDEEVDKLLFHEALQNEYLHFCVYKNRICFKCGMCD